MSARRRKAHLSHDRWLVSYADFITLLFSFFVVLYAFAKADAKKRIEVTAAVDSAFRTMGLFGDVSRQPSKNADAKGVEQPPVAMNIVMGEEIMSPARVKDDLNRIRRDLEQRLSNQVAEHTVSIKMGRDGLVISLREAGFFGSGSATPRPETLPTLRQIAATLGRSPYDMRVEGHTDNVPIHNAEFDSNWELSSARATRITRLFLGLKAISADHLSAAGYAEFHPVATNSTQEGRAENRRIDLVVMPRSSINLAAAAPQSSTGAWRKIGDQ